MKEKTKDIFVPEHSQKVSDEEKIQKAIHEVECFLEMYGIWQSSTTKEGLCRYIAKRFAHGDDYFNLVAYSLAVAGFKPTKERISYLTRRHGRMPSRPDFEKLDLQNPEWDEDCREEDLQDK